MLPIVERHGFGRGDWLHAAIFLDLVDRGA
jgi:hypothetical protein